jgi:hypothetical protein
LDELKARASAYEENSVLERDTAIEPLGAQQLVDRVMPPDIFSYHQKITLYVEECGGMQSTGVGKHLLPTFQPSRQQMDS